MNVRVLFIHNMQSIFFRYWSVKEMDFDQPKDFEATPALDTRLYYFDFPVVETGSRIMFHLVLQTIDTPNDTQVAKGATSHIYS